MQPIEVNFNNETYTNVFVGTVRAVDEGNLPNGPTYTIEVGNTYRGNVSGTIEVSTAGHSCGSFYGEGVSMIWFMQDDTTYVDETNPQYRVNTVSEADAMIRAIDVATNTSTGDTTARAPSTCKVWFDGCNTCTKETIDGEYMCTEMACADYEQSECRVHFTAEEGAPYVAGPQSNPEENFVGPTTAPPEIAEEETTIEELPWWQRLWQWIKGLFN